MEATPAARPDGRSRTDPESLIDALEEPSRPRSPPISLGSAGCASRGRSCRSSSRSAIIAFFLYLNRDRLAPVPELHPPGQPGARPARRSSCSTSASRCAATAGSGSCARPGFVIGLRNSTEILYISWFVNCVVPAKLGDVYRAYLLKMNSAGVAQPDVRDGLHRADPRHLRDRDPRPRGRVLELPRAGCRRRSGSSSSSASWSSSSPPSGCSRCATSGAGSCLGCRCRRAILELYERFEEGVFGAVGLRHLPIARLHHRADLADRGPAPVHRRRWRSASPTSSSGCRARSSSPSSARC